MDEDGHSCGTRDFNGQFLDRSMDAASLSQGRANFFFRGEAEIELTAFMSSGIG